MKIKYIIICSIFCYLVLVGNQIIAQERYDNNWAMGVNYTNDPDFRVFLFNFDDYELNIQVQDTTVKGGIYGANATAFSTSEGSLIMSTNGKSLVDDNFNIVPNGDSLNYGPLWDLSKYTYQSPEGTRIIPEPGNEKNGAIMVHLQLEWSTKIHQYIGKAINISKIRIKDGKADTVLYKNMPIDTGNLDFFEMCKHANGRDWWVLYPNRYTNTIKRFLITPNGTSPIESQALPNEYFTNFAGFHRMSPDGSYYVTVEAFNNIKRYDFDRCTGELQNQKIFEVDTVKSGFSAFSQNSRYLYVVNKFNILQFEMYAQDFKPDTVATLIPTYENGGMLTFGFMQLAADGKIYIASGGSVHKMSVINDPDKAGKACDVSQMSIDLPAYNYQCVNKFPYYRLGPLEGSGCDTLGIKNIPIAKFRYVKDPNIPGQVDFIDLSDYNPTTWLWDFGDGEQSPEPRPLHSYKKTGIYKVCLTVTNKYGSDTYCKTLDCTTATEEEIPSHVAFQLYPNPVKDILMLKLSEAVNQNLVVKIRDLNGRTIFQERLSFQSGFNTLNIAQIGSGMYFIEVSNPKEILYHNKFIKM